MTVDCANQPDWAAPPQLLTASKALRFICASAECTAVLQAIVASARIVPVPPVSVGGIGACIDGVYTDSQLVSSILLGRSFFTLHLEDAIR